MRGFGVDEQRQRVGHWRAPVSTLAEGSGAAEHQQTAPATLDELRDHLQLIA